MHYLDEASAAIVGVLLVAAGISDLRTGRVPAPLSAAAVGAGAAAALLSHSLTTALLGLAVAAPFLVAWLLMPALVGGADLKLTAAAALATGWPAAAFVVFVALAMLWFVQSWSQLRRRRSPTVYCAGLAAAYMLIAL